MLFVFFKRRLYPESRTRPRRQIEMVHWVKRTSLELIGKSGLGYSFDSLTENAVEHPYSRSVKMFK